MIDEHFQHVCLQRTQRALYSSCPQEVSVRQYSVKDSPAHFMHRKTDDEEKQSAQLFYRSTIQYLKEKMAP